jgi:hypothetical protein
VRLFVSFEGFIVKLFISLLSMLPFILIIDGLLWAGLTYGGITWVLFGAGALIVALLACLAMEFSAFKRGV